MNQAHSHVEIAFIISLIATGNRGLIASLKLHIQSIRTTNENSLTHTLFNLIKRPDEQQRQIIMDACVSLSRNVGEMRTETELLPQCWEQINHTYQERRLLVAQSCGELAEYVRPEIRDSLILSTIQQLIEDSATVVREAAAHNLALLLPLFPNTNKYFKVEEMMFQFICDPSGLVVETTLKELLPAVMKCSPLSRIELRTAVYQKAVETCPFPSTAKSEECVFSVSLLETYAEGRSEWPMFEWMHVDKSKLATHCILPLLLAGVLGAPSKHEDLTNFLRQLLLESKTKKNQSSKRNNNEVLDAVHFLCTFEEP
ncbi:hypothetical protein F2Q70_00006041 [Brassica cretica]|uniref:Condensin complex subunit 1 C-terminal domain-containing protein n=1 Tax=Brassica cretica TaxID=69181 RepID=A0A8S9IRE8_BRACR|nr:hypothetical protein F2Q70_00006041 [Brassica cretica]